MTIDDPLFSERLMPVVTEELWRKIKGFPSYSISNYGQVNNDERSRPVPTSLTNHGHAKVSIRDNDGRRHTRSVALLVAQAFCRPPDRRSNSVVILDGFLENVFAWNLVWRPRWFAWLYARQLHTKPPRYYETLPVINITEDVTYRSVVDAAMCEGLLFEDVWRSSYTGEPIYPHRNIYQILK